MASVNYYVVEFCNLVFPQHGDQPRGCYAFDVVRHQLWMPGKSDSSSFDLDWKPNGHFFLLSKALLVVKGKRTTARRTIKKGTLILSRQRDKTIENLIRGSFRLLLLLLLRCLDLFLCVVVGHDGVVSQRERKDDEKVRKAQTFFSFVCTRTA